MPPQHEQKDYEYSWLVLNDLRGDVISGLKKQSFCQDTRPCKRRPRKATRPVTTDNNLPALTDILAKRLLHLRRQHSGADPEITGRMLRGTMYLEKFAHADEDELESHARVIFAVSFSEPSKPSFVRLASFSARR